MFFIAKAIGYLKGMPVQTPFLDGRQDPSKKARTRPEPYLILYLFIIVFDCMYLILYYKKRRAEPDLLEERRPGYRADLGTAKRPK